jgi:prepilin-type N-terminal cleavage/methylation domain-containing protein
MDIGHKLHTTSSRQQGFSLMEIMISLTLSLVVTAAMVALMSSSLGNTSRIVNMTKLTDDMRMTMQMLTRDVRRTSYNANAMFCYANDDCGTDGSLTMAPDISISAGGDCFTYLLDRDHDGDSTENDAGGFRRVTAGGVGVIEMWIGDASPDCGAADSNWVNITNPDSMDIASFAVDDDLSYSDVIFDDGAGFTISQRVRKLRINMRAQLTANDSISRDIEDIISVRNDILF